MNHNTWKPIQFRIVYLAGALAVLIFAATTLWHQPLVGHAENITDDPTERPTMVPPTATLAPTETPAPTATTSPTPLPTPIPWEWRENKDQTTGVVIGGIFMVLIVVGGTVSVIVRRNRSEEP
jgi:hypothetical protein